MTSGDSVGGLEGRRKLRVDSSQRDGLTSGINPRPNPALKALSKDYDEDYPRSNKSQVEPGDVDSKHCDRKSTDHQQ